MSGAKSLDFCFVAPLRCAPAYGSVEMSFLRRLTAQLKSCPDTRLVGRMVKSGVLPQARAEPKAERASSIPTLRKEREEWGTRLFREG